MNNDTIYCSNYEAQLKNGYLRIKGITHLDAYHLPLSSMTVIFAYHAKSSKKADW